MSKTLFYLVAGARPNFIKLAPLVRALQRRSHLDYKIIHTGQHYDEAMSRTFFQVLQIPAPHVNLEVGSGQQGEQTARILERFESLLLERLPSAVVVFGDVNSTMACAIAAAKLCVPVAHVEAGLRSFDRSMPEEINRLVTDALSEWLFVSEVSGLINLTHEGIPASKIHFVGNIMIDSLAHMLPRALERDTLHTFGLEAGQYAMLTMHRPSNVDHTDKLQELLNYFNTLAEELTIVFPAHPRTRQRIQESGVPLPTSPNFKLIQPVDYLDSLCLQKHARLVFTDSGGMQEETTYLNVPCLTLRENTERPVTIEYGTSTLVGNDPKRIDHAYRQIIAGKYKTAKPILLWDGCTAERIAEVLEASFG